MPQTDTLTTTIPSATAAPESPAVLYFPEIRWRPGSVPFFPERDTNDTAKAKLVDDMISGEFDGVVRVYAMNIGAGSSWDASKEIAHAICDALPSGEPIPEHLMDFLENTLGCGQVAQIGRELNPPRRSSVLRRAA